MKLSSPIAPLLRFLRTHRRLGVLVICLIALSSAGLYVYQQYVLVVINPPAVSTSFSNREKIVDQTLLDGVTEQAAAKEGPVAGIGNVPNPFGD